MLGYNGQLYSHHSIAAKSPNGVVGISILAKVYINIIFEKINLNKQIGHETNPELERIIKAASKLKYAGKS